MTEINKFIRETQQKLVESRNEMYQVFPMRAKHIYEDGEWRKKFKTFDEFVKAPYPIGFSMKWEDFHHFCEAYGPALDMLKEVNQSIKESIC